MGQKKLDNGAVLFVFVDDRKMRLEVGYGLEGALPDAIAKRIVADTMTPEFRAGRPARGLDAGIDAMIAATRGEYKAPPRRARRDDKRVPPIVILIFVVLMLVFISAASRGVRDGRRLVSEPDLRPARSAIGAGFGGGLGGGGGFGGGGGGRRWRWGWIQWRRRLLRGRRGLRELVAMDPKELMAELDDERIVAAIQRAESRSRGEIRVHVTSEAVGDPENAAAETFARLGMTADRRAQRHPHLRVAARPDVRGHRRPRACTSTAARPSGRTWRPR